MCPSYHPTSTPSAFPTLNPTIEPTANPTLSPTLVPCGSRSEEQCNMDDGSICYFNTETQSCIEIDACDTNTCSTFCIHEVENTCDAFSNSTHLCSCQRCPGVTECQSIKSERLHFDEDFDATFPTTEKETE